MAKNNNLKEINRMKEIIVRILKKHGIKKAGIFGSYVRGEQKKNSDVDILIEPTKEMSLLDVVGIEFELKSKLKRDIDLITYGGLYHLLKEKILNEEVRII